MEIILGLFVIFMIFLFFGVGAAGFHVFKYSGPRDKLLFSFFVFLAVMALSFFGVISYVMRAI